MSRRDELEANLRRLRTRIDTACQEANRDPAQVRLLAVTKYFPASDVATLIDLGLTDFAENKDQEAAAKTAEVAELRPDAKPRWHMVGNVQRNKARSVATWADEVQSVDRGKLVNALAKAATEREYPLDVLLQVSMDGDPARGGCPVDEVPALAADVAGRSELRLRGVMTIVPLDTDPDAEFARLDALAGQLRARYPELTEVSAGMSGDLEQAIAHGSTCVRVGTALLGARPIASFDKR